jgi:hypothetical protein
MNTIVGMSSPNVPGRREQHPELVWRTRLARELRRGAERRDGNCHRPLRTALDAVRLPRKHDREPVVVLLNFSEHAVTRRIETGEVERDVRNRWRKTTE